jgi:hypothetical protein
MIAVPIRMGGSRGLTALRCYLWVAGTALFVQGIVSLIALHWGQGASDATHGTLSADSHHPWVHIIYGCVILASLLTQRPERELATLAITFGIFYLGLFALGILTHNPFGLILKGGQNVFHLFMGSTSLAVGLRARRQTRGVKARATGRTQ